MAARRICRDIVNPVDDFRGSALFALGQGLEVNTQQNSGMVALDRYRRDSLAQVAVPT